MKKFVLVALIATSSALAAPPEGKPAFVTDQVVATMREQPRMEAAAKKNLKSGTHIFVLETLGPDSFARVRTEDGVEGWIPARYISDLPAAVERLAPLQAELKQARERIGALEHDLAQAKDALAKAAPALQLADDNEKLKAQMAEKEKAVEQMQQQYSEEEARRKTLITGAALVGGGIVLGLILPMLRGGRRRGGF